MSYKGELDILKKSNYINNLYFEKNENGQPPPIPPKRFLLQENGAYLLLEDGGKIILES